MRELLSPRLLITSRARVGMAFISSASSRTGNVSELERVVRCAIYARKSTEEGLEQDFNTLQAQRETAEAYIFQSKAERLAFTGAALRGWWVQRSQPGAPALQQLLTDIPARQVDCVVV
jgi:hypothetical protein